MNVVKCLNCESIVPQLIGCVVCGYGVSMHPLSKEQVDEMKKGGKRK